MPFKKLLSDKFETYLHYANGNWDFTLDSIPFKKLHHNLQCVKFVKETWPENLSVVE